MAGARHQEALEPVRGRLMFHCSVWGGEVEPSSVTDDNYLSVHIAVPIRKNDKTLTGVSMYISMSLCVSILS